MKTIMSRGGLIFIVTVLLLAGFIVTNLISYTSAKNTLRDNIINTSLPLTRDNIYSEIQRDVMLPVYVASLMSHDTFLRDWVLSGEEDISTVTRYLSEIKNKYGFFISFFVSEKSKWYYFHDGALKTVSPENPLDAWYYSFKDKHIPYELNVDYSEAKNSTLTIFINHRVYDFNHNLIGVTGVGLSLERITNLLSAYKVKYNRNIYMTDRNGLVKAHYDRKKVDSMTLGSTEGLKDIAEEILNIGYQSENFEYDKGDSHILLTKRYIPELDWFLIVEQNQDTAIEEIWTNFVKSSVLGISISAAVLLIIISAVNYYNKRLEKLAATDELTGIYNRREFSRLFDKAVQWHKRTGMNFSVILVDIDRFKNINDTEGHLKGDRIIKTVTNICRSSVREKDLLARWGGDEFILLIFGDIHAAVSAAERIRSMMTTEPELKMYDQAEKPVTLSMGITEYTHGDTEDSITLRADDALYSAKEQGRDRYITALPKS